jgi:hypothetical protein
LSVLPSEGLRFLIEITGQGERFDIFQLVITVGSGVAFFGGVTLFTDYLIQYLHPRGKHFDKAKRANLQFEPEERPLLIDNRHINSSSERDDRLNLPDGVSEDTPIKFD